MPPCRYMWPPGIPCCEYCGAMAIISLWRNIHIFRSRRYSNSLRPLKFQVEGPSILLSKFKQKISLLCSASYLKPKHCFKAKRSGRRVERKVCARLHA